MSPDDYRGRKLRHRATGHDGTVLNYVTNVIGQDRFRIRFADGSEDQLSLDQIQAAFDWTDEPVVALPDNVVMLQSRRARAVTIDPGSGDAA